MTSLDARIANLFPSIILNLQESIRIPSIQGDPTLDAPFGIQVKEALNHALKTASSLGFKTYDLDGYVGWAEYGESENMIVVLGHLDVVPSGEGWTRPPFGGEIHGNKMFGRGVMDDKGPIIGALWALYAIKELSIPVKRRIRILFGTNEESGMKDMYYYLEHGGEIPIMGFTPDGEFPIVAYEKGQLHVRIKVPFVQPNNSKALLLGICGGTVPNVVPSEAEAKIRFFDPSEKQKILNAFKKVAREKGIKVAVNAESEIATIKVSGVAAHGSTPELGVNAIANLLYLLGYSIDEDWGESLRGLSGYFYGDVNGVNLGIFLEDELSGKLTCNLGQINFEDGCLSLILDIRFPVSFKFEDVILSLESLSQKEGFSLNILRKKAPLNMPKDSILIKKLQKVYEEKTGQEAKLLSMGGGTYAKALPNIVAFGPKFPESPDVAHQADEFIDLEEYLKILQIMGAAMVELAN